MLDAEQVQIVRATPATLALRAYQKKFVNDVYSQIRGGVKRILGFAPTGAGKTLITAQIAAHAVSKNKRILFIVHRDILISQTADKIYKFGLSNCGFIKSGCPESRDSRVQIASVQTLSKRNWWHQFPADLVIIDECHIVAYASVVQQMMMNIYPQAIYLGLTATPWRLSKREGLGDIFHSLVSAPMPHELISQAFLVKPSYYSVKQADLEKVGTVAGEFDESRLALACDRPELIEQIVRDWQRLAYGRRTIVFGVNVAHAQHLAEAFQAAGISAAYVTGSTPAKQTNQIYQQLADGEIRVLCSCMKLTEGFDVCAVSAVLLCRPTMSRALHFQMIGRGLRLSPETEKIDCVVIDQAGNVQRHGFVEDLKEIHLDQSEEPQDIEAPKKICPTERGGCGAILYAFHMKCHECGYIFELPKKVYLVPGLEQLLSEEDIERYEFYRDHLRAAYNRDFAPGWAAMGFKEQYGHWPPDAWGTGAIFGDKPTPEQQASYRNYLEAIARRLEKPDSWIQRHMELELGFRQAA